MQSIHSARMFFFLILLGGILSGAGAQDLDTHPTRGFMPTMDQLSSPVDNIEVSSGKLHLQIPLASLPRGKGGTGYDLNLEYDSHLYDVDPVTQYEFYNNQWRSYLYKYLHPVSYSGGWTYNAKNYDIEMETKAGAIVDEDCFQNPLFNAAGVRNVRYRLVLPDGSMHILHLREWENSEPEGAGDGYNFIYMNGKPNQCAVHHYGYSHQYTGWLTYYTNDGSYLKLEVYADGTESYFSNWKLYYPDGRRVILEDGLRKEYDANGNYISIANACYDPLPEGDCSRPYTSIYDASNREILIEYNTTDANLSTDTLKRDEVIAPGPNGDVTYAIDWQALEIGGTGSGRDYYVGQYLDYTLVRVPLSVRFWTVKYIQLPSPQDRPNYPVPLGNVPPEELSYEFGYWDNIVEPDEDPGYGQLDQMRMPSGALYKYQYTTRTYTVFDADNIALGSAVSQKKITHDSVSDMLWTYTYDGNHTHVTNPDLGQTTHYLDSNSLVTSIVDPSGSIRARQWEKNTPYGLRDVLTGETPQNPYIAKEILTVKDSSGKPTKSAVTDFSYDRNGNLLSKTEHDWAAYSTNPNPPGGTIKRKTEFIYFVTLQDPNDVNAYWNPHNTARWPAGTARRLNAVNRRTVSNGSTAFAVTGYTYDFPYSKGNVIKEWRWDSVKSSSFAQLNENNTQVLTRGYDSYGNLTDIYEPEVRTHITYDAAGNVVTRVDKGYGTSAQRSWQYQWLNGVAIEWKKDLDNNITASYTYDDVGRQLTMTEAGLRRTVTSYDDINRKVTVTGDLRSYMDGKLQSVTSYDQLGRVKLVQKSDGAPLNSVTDGIKVQTFDTYPYPSGVRRVVTSTPYRNADHSDPMLEWTCTQYDLAGRVAAVAMFKGSPVPTDCANITNRTGLTTTLYDSEWTIVTDPVAKVRKQKRDGLGRLVQVIEDPSGLNYSTTYTYDPLDNLTGVTQGAQTRSFAYSSLSRLTSAANPESGTTSYTYHDSGDLKRRTDARGVWSESAYDPLHRILTKTYSDSTPPVTYEYHLAGSSSSPNIGQLKSVSSGVAATLYSYNQLGNVTESYHAISGFPGNLAFNYDWYLNGGLKSIQYPSGRQVSYDVDDAGRSNKVYATGKTYADMTAPGITYPFTPDGRIAQMKLGNYLWETHDYRTPGTATVHKLGETQGSGNLLQLEYNFKATSNNGNLDSQVTSRPGNVWQQDFTYDNVNRLSTAMETGGVGSGWTRTYGYDQYGNRWVETSPGLTHMDPKEPGAQSNFSASTNRMITTGMQYDSSGNQRTYGVYTLEYDAESRNISVASTGSGSGSFAYDGDGRRVKKLWTPSVGPAVTTYFVYNALGQLAGEYSSQAPTSLGTTYPFTDMLGSVRAITSETPSVVECYDYLPFGRMLSASDNGRSIGCYPTDPDAQFTSRIPQKFTSKERDAETGLDFFLARYYSGAQGRFLSPDEFKGGIVDPFTGKDIETNTALPYADITDPQTLNKYVYVRNNPLRYTDPNGHCFDPTTCGLEFAGAGTMIGGPAGAALGGVVGVLVGAAILYEGYHIVKESGGLISKSESKPGTLGKPDHKETVKEEAERINGKPEQTIATPGGQKESRRPDAVGTNSATGAPEIVQVYRPTPAGNIPKREKDAAKDIQDATGTKPTMVPVRPLRPREMPCTVTGTCPK